MSDNLRRPTSGGTAPHADEQGSAPGAPSDRSDTARAIGERLAAARAAKGWSVEEVSARLKIAAFKLHAIETGDLSLLPDTTFAIGLVRSYAKMLDLDPTPLVDSLRRLRGAVSPDFSLPTSRGTGARRAHVPLTWSTRRSETRSWLWAVCAAIVVLIVLAIWHGGGESSSWFARLRANAPDAAGNHTATVSIATDSAGIGPGGASGADLASSVPLAGSTDAGSTTAAATDAGSATAATLAAVSSALAPGQSAPGASVAPVAPASVGVGGPGLHIAALQDTWVGVRQQDGKEIYAGIVRQGTEQTIQGQQPFKLVIGNVAGIASIALDGKPIDLSAYAGAKNNVARITLPGAPAAH